jgi:hypothetical protein
MRNPIHILIPTGHPHFIFEKMDFSMSSITNISVKQQREEYSLKKEAYHGTSSSDNDSDESNDDDKKVSIVKTNDDEQKISPIRADDVQPYDILCGRDKATFNNVGNRRFRVSISLNIPRYEAAKTKAQKAQVIKYICYVLQNEVGVRFLKKDKSVEVYIELDASEARKKVGHALRDMSVARQSLTKKRESIKSVEQQHNNDDLHRRTPSIKGNDSEPTIRPDFDDPLLEPLPIDEQRVSVGSSVGSCRDPQNRQFQKQQDHHQIHPSHELAHLLKNQFKADIVPDLVHRERRKILEQQQQQANDLQESLKRLAQQQEKLQQDREELLQQQQYQQQLLQQQIRNRRCQREQQQQQDPYNEFDHFFDTFPMQKRRRR